MGNGAWTKTTRLAGIALWVASSMWLQGCSSDDSLVFGSTNAVSKHHVDDSKASSNFVRRPDPVSGTEPNFDPDADEFFIHNTDLQLLLRKPKHQRSDTQGLLEPPSKSSSRTKVESNNQLKHPVEG